MAQKTTDLQDNAGQPASDGECQPHVYTVSEISRVVKGVLEDVFDAVWIEGEISNLRVPASKHTYFVFWPTSNVLRSTHGLFLLWLV